MNESDRKNKANNNEIYFNKITYLPRTVNLLPEWDDSLIVNSPYYIQNKEEFIALSQRYTEYVKYQIIADICIRDTSCVLPAKCGVTGRGLGVYAVNDICENSFIGEYTGYLQIGSGDKYCWDYPEVPGYNELELSALKGGNETRFINHSFQPNCYADHFPVDGIYVIIITSLNNITAGSELLLDYGDNYWAAGDREVIVEK
jgi:uncharacterized protein